MCTICTQLTATGQIGPHGHHVTPPAGLDIDPNTGSVIIRRHQTTDGSVKVPSKKLGIAFCAIAQVRSRLPSFIPL